MAGGGFDKAAFAFFDAEAVEKGGVGGDADESACFAEVLGDGAAPLIHITRDRRGNQQPRIFL